MKQTIDDIKKKRLQISESNSFKNGKEWKAVNDV